MLIGILFCLATVLGGQGPIDDKVGKGDRLFVMVMLEHPDWPADLTQQRELTRALQQRVLLEELASDFEVVRRYLRVPALAGWIERPLFKRLKQAAKRGDSLIRALDADVAGRAEHIKAGGGGLVQSIPLVGADLVHQLGITGAGIEVAILDSGLDRGHPNLVSSLVAEACFCFNPNGDCCPDGSASQLGPGSARDDHGHGTHVTGILAGDGVVGGVGMAPDASITMVKMLDATNSFFSSSDIVAGLDWIHANRPDVGVVSMSLFTNALFTDVCDQSFSWTQALHMAVANLVDKGVVVIAIAGNDGLDGRLTAPGCLSNVVVVGATSLNDVVAPFSNKHELVDLYAPGVSIQSSAIGGGLANLSGTSMACPHASGLAALMLQADNALSPAVLLQTMKDSGVAVLESAGVAKPRINAKAAVERVLDIKTDCPDTATVVRMLPHLTAAGGPFETRIVITNRAAEPRSFSLMPYLASGEALAVVQGMIEAGRTRILMPLELFGNDRVSHFLLDSENSLHFSLTYRATFADGAPVHVQESHGANRWWLVQAGDWQQTWDGLAVVRIGSGSEDVTIAQIDETGAVLATDTIAAGLAANAKALYVIRDRFQPHEGGYYLVSSQQPLVVLALRGDLSSRFLWENSAIPTPDCGN